MLGSGLVVNRKYNGENGYIDGGKRSPLERLARSTLPASLASWVSSASAYQVRLLAEDHLEVKETITENLFLFRFRLKGTKWFGDIQ